MKIMRILGSPLYQWEVGRQLEILPTPGVHINLVHFTHLGDSECLVVEPRTENDRIVVDIPDVMLQSGNNIVAYSVCASAECEETICDCVFPVCPRPKPTGYVYTETDVATVVANYMTENPVEIPTNVSAFENDAGYLTEHQDLSGYAKTINGIAPDENGNVQIESTVQPDWNQNDSTAKDYVKNRPFYHDIFLTTLAETEVLQGNRSYALPSAEYVYGDEYIIEINGEKYTMSLSWQYNYYDANYLLGFNLIHGMTVYGGVKPASSTFHLYGWGEKLFYDEPAKGDRFNFVLHAYVNKSSGITLPASVKILKEEQELRTIDKKYLPAEYLEPSDKEEILAAIPVTAPMLLNADMAETYLNDSSYGDAALEAIKNGRDIEVKVPNADGGNYTVNYSPVYFKQLPNFENKYLYLFYLKDEKQDLSALLGQPAGTVLMPTYGQLKMLLSQEYNSNPLEV